MIRRTTVAPLALALATVTACAAESIPPENTDPGDDTTIDLPPEATELEPTGTSLNGTSLNGTSLNGTSLNGTGLNGLTLNGAFLSGATLGDGSALSNGALAASAFSGKKSDGSVVSGAGFVGALFNGQLSDGSTLKLRVDSRTQLAGSNADTFAYGVSYQTNVGWAPLCGKDASQQPVLAVPVGGIWNYKQGVAGGGAFTADAARFTFACRATAIAKCVELGYKPWKTVGGVGLQNHLNACTRMLRADYCGDGKSWTVNGTPINLYDSLGVQTDTQPWTVEAEWNASGARYVSLLTDKRYRLAGWAIPPCFLLKLSPLTGLTSNFSSGTLLMDEYN
jgi:hypothetical protein